MYNWASVSTSAKIVHCPFCGRASILDSQSWNCTHLASVMPSETGLALVEYRHPNAPVDIRIEHDSNNT